MTPKRQMILRHKLADAKALLADIEMFLEHGYRSSDEDELYERIRAFLHGRAAVATQGRQPIAGQWPVERDAPSPRPAWGNTRNFIVR